MPELSDLISPEYLAEMKRLHAAPRGFGGKGHRWAPIVTALVEMQDAITRAKCFEPDTLMPLQILDYGCGQGTLGQAVAGLIRAQEGRYTKRVLKGIWTDFDPVYLPTIPRGPFDLIVCTDVLEHVEPSKILAVLDYFRQVLRPDGELFTVIGLRETDKKLSDGRQAHINLLGEQSWKALMAQCGFLLRSDDFPNDRPQKQYVAAWRAV